MSEEFPQPEMSRRHFLRGALAIGGGLAVTSMIAAPVLMALERSGSDEPVADNQPDEAIELATTTPAPMLSVREPEQVVEATPEPVEDKKELPSIWQFPAWYEELGSPDQSIGKGVLQALLVDGAMIPTMLISNKLGIPMGNAGLMEQKNKKPTRSDYDALDIGALVAWATVIAPIIEEAKYRALPSGLLNFVQRNNPDYSKTSAALAPALITSGFFAHSHNKGTENYAVPLPQFASGMLFWRQQRNNGFMHNVVSHGASNMALLGPAAALALLKKPSGVI